MFRRLKKLENAHGILPNEKQIKISMLYDPNYLDNNRKTCVFTHTVYVVNSLDFTHYVCDLDNSKSLL